MRLKKCFRKKSSLPGSNLGLLCKQPSHMRLQKCNPYTQLSGTYYPRNALFSAKKHASKKYLVSNCDEVHNQ